MASITSPRMRRAALLAAGAWAVHELRFALAPVDGGDGPGHTYLHLLVPALTALLALAVAGFAARLATPRPEEGGGPRTPVDALACAAVMFTAFVLQEGGESLLSAHGSVFGAGGWLAAPLSLALGLLVALALRGATAAVAAAPGRAPRAVAAPRPALVIAPEAARPHAAAPLRHLAARPPPGAPVLQH